MKLLGINQEKHEKTEDILFRKLENSKRWSDASHVSNHNDIIITSLRILHTLRETLEWVRAHRTITTSKK